MACCVRLLPDVDAIKASLRRHAMLRQPHPYDMWAMTRSRSMVHESRSGAPHTTHMGDAAREKGSRLDGGRLPPAATTTTMTSTRRSYAREDGDALMPPAMIWAVRASSETDIDVVDAQSGRCVMRIANVKARVSISTLVHAPFRGLLTRRLRVIPIRQPRDMLRVDAKHLMDTDYVWVGLSDGSIRLIPAHVRRIPQSVDRATRAARDSLADVVFELPKYHTAAIVAMERSPCHGDGGAASVEESTMRRLSAAVRYRTAATAHRDGAAVGESAWRPPRRRGGRPLVLTSAAALHRRHKHRLGSQGGIAETMIVTMTMTMWGTARRVGIWLRTVVAAMRATATVASTSLSSAPPRSTRPWWCGMWRRYTRRWSACGATMRNTVVRRVWGGLDHALDDRLACIELRCGDTDGVQRGGGGAGRRREPYAHAAHVSSFASSREE